MTKIKQYHYLTNRIFAKCSVYFIPERKEQAKYEIDCLIRRFVEVEK